MDNNEPKQNDEGGQTSSVEPSQDREGYEFGINSCVAGSGDAETSDDVKDSVEEGGGYTEVRGSPSSCRIGLGTDKRKRHCSKSDCVAIAPIEPLKISTVAGTTKRSSTRIVKKTRRDLSPPLSPVKRIAHAGNIFTLIRYSIRSPCFINPLSYFSFQPVLYDWCNKGCGILSVGCCI